MSDSIHNDLVDSWLIDSQKGYQKYIAEDPLLHKNSIELVEICKQSGILDDCRSCFEIGCGSGRNLSYILRSKQFEQVYGNDLCKKECFKHMSEDLKAVISFFESDTLKLVQENCIKIDLMIASDHLMHIDADSVQKILDEICNKWKPKYFILRETKIERENGRRKKFVHDFSTILKYYKCILNQVSQSDNQYVIQIFKIV